MVKTGDVKFGDKSNCLPEGFWSAVDVWIKKPHVVNKRLCGATQTEDRDVDIAELKELLPKLTQCTSDELNEVVLFLSNRSDQNDHSTDTQWSLTIRTIIPKVNTYGRNVHKEVILRGLTGQKVTFLPIEQDKDGQHSLRKSNVYQIQLNGLTDEVWTMSLHTLHPEAWVCDGVAYPKLAWLGGDLLAKLARWATDSHSSEFKSTLSLIPIEKYSLQYQQLKDKYKNMVKVWPEVTDPEKFVYEDVAIATYLLVLWEEERAEKGLIDRQSFVDLGCGNGLLVHILTNEGHPGKGIDVRKRNIWDMYGPQTHLEESAISPGEGCLFPNADWLIGNHSDELTPWIPLIAARSSSSCRFFLLPCCFFDFYGKHQRRRCGASQYREYIDYISHICTQCGFETQEDCLRIPSTKRVCLIGRGRSYSASEEATVEEQRRELLSLSHQRHQHHPASSSSNATRLQGDADRQQQDGEAEEEGRCGRHDNPSDGDGWGGGGFRPRERVEVVRNCATLPREFVDGVVLRVARTLLGLTCRGQQEQQQEEEENGQNGKEEKNGEEEEEEEEEVVKKKKKKKNGEEDLIKSRGQRQQQEDKNGGNEVKEKKMDGEEVKKGEEEEEGRNREGRLQQQDGGEEMDMEKDGQKEENKKKEEEEEDDEEEAASRKAWNSGGSLSIREVAELLDASELQRLKSECGGLQTLLRNNHQVFRVEGGRVYIRDWRAAVLSRGGAGGGARGGRGGARRGRGGASVGTGGDATKRKPLASPPDGAVKTRLCWFHAHHPHGCPLPAPQCPFAHGPDELRPSTRPIKKPRH